MKSILLQITFVAMLAAGCGGGGSMRIPPPIPDDRREIPAPRPRKISLPIDAFDKQVAREIESWFDLSRYVRAIGRAPKEAFDVDAFDEVPNSSWFTNRNHRHPMTREQIMRGPAQGDGPDAAGPWTIIRAKTEGVTPGFTIKDAKGARFVIKFDPPGYPELATGAENITTRLFYAAGYNTPENYVVHFDPANLRIGDGVVIKDAAGIEHDMTRKDLDAILKRVEFSPDGTIRATASKFLKGEILGPFRYHGTRQDDPNDIIPHEHRRELRGMRMIAAWLNHWDTKAGNSLDVYVEDGGVHYVRHYLIDFGSTLGSQGDEPMPKWTGYESAVDPGQTLRNAIGFGFYTPAWEIGRDIEYPSIGRFDYEIFEPMKFKFIIPNMAFKNMTNRDGMWGARIVTSFSDEQLEAAVESGEYSDPRAAAYLLEVLKKRRDIIGRYWFTRMNPLDQFSVAGRELEFVDLATERGYEAAENTTYRCDITRDGKAVATGVDLGHERRVELPDPGTGVLEIAIRTRRGDGKWSRAVRVYLEPSGKSPYELVALERES